MDVLIQKQNKKKYSLSLIFFLTLIGLTFYVLLKDQELTKLLLTLKKADPGFLLLGLGMMLLYVACEGWNIRLLCGSLSQKISWRACLKYAFIGFYFSSITPSATGGQPLQAYYMKKDGIPLSLSSLTLLCILMVYQGVNLFFVGMVFFLKWPLVLSHSGGIKLLLLCGVLLNMMMFAFMVTVFVSDKTVCRFVLFCGRLLNKLRLIKNPAAFEANVIQQITEYKAGLVYLKRNSAVLLKVCCVTFLQFICFFSIPYFVYKSLSLTGFGITDFLAMQAILNITVSFLPLPGGVGASESVFMILFQTFYPAQMVFPAMLLSRGISFYAILIISGTITLLTHVRRPSKRLVLAKRKTSQVIS